MNEKAEKSDVKDGISVVKAINRASITINLFRETGKKVFLVDINVDTQIELVYSSRNGILLTGTRTLSVPQEIFLTIYGVLDIDQAYKRKPVQAPNY